jgi:hypothetical protein
VDYRTRRTILPTPAATLAPQVNFPEATDEGNGGSAATVILLLLLAAGAAAVFAFMYSRRRQRQMETEIGVLAERAREDLRGQVPRAALDATGGHPGPEMFIVVEGPSETTRFRVENEPATIGTAETSQLRLANGEGSVAEEHARVWSRDGKLVFHHIAKAGNSLMGGRPVSWASLDNGDEVQIGPYKLRVEIL